MTSTPVVAAAAGSACSRTASAINASVRVLLDGDMGVVPPEGQRPARAVEQSGAGGHDGAHARGPRTEGDDAQRAAAVDAAPRTHARERDVDQPGRTGAGRLESGGASVGGEQIPL